MGGLSEADFFLGAAGLRFSVKNAGLAVLACDFGV